MTYPSVTSQQQPRVERILTWFTLVFAVVFAPIETIVSWKYGLLSPYYLVDALGIVLLFWGAMRSIRRRCTSSPSVMTVGWAWMSANFWRAAMERDLKFQQGGTLDLGEHEIRLAVAITALAILCMATGIWLMTQRDKRDYELSKNHHEISP